MLLALPVSYTHLEIEPNYIKLSDANLVAKTDEFKRRLQKGETLDDLLPEAFAVVREASKRVLGMRHFCLLYTSYFHLYALTVVHLWQHKGIGVKLVLQIYYIFVIYHINFYTM